MISRFVKFFSRKTSGEIYSQKERGIYHYWDGSKEVKADPLALYKKFRSIWPELSADLKIASSELLDAKETIPAHDKALEKIRMHEQVTRLSDY